MRLSKQVIRKWVLIILLFLDLSGFYMIVFPSAINSYIRFNKAFLAVLAIIIFIFFINRNLISNNISSFLHNYIIVLCFSLLCLIGLTAISNPGQKMITFFIGCSPYLLMFFSLYFIEIMIRDGNTDDFFKYFNIIAFVWYILLIIQSYQYNYNGSLFMLTSQTNERILTRDSGIRLGIGTVGNLMILYNFHIIIQKHRKALINIILFAMGIYCAFMIQQTRMYNIAIIISLAMIYISAGKITSKRITRICFIAVVLVFFLNSQIAQSFFDSFSVTGDSGNNTLVRLKSINYYMSIFYKSPIFGFGLTSNEKVYSGGGLYDLTDVGFIGLLAQSGLFSIILFIIPVIRLIYILKESNKAKNRVVNYPLMVGLCVFVITTAGSLIITNQDRAMIIPIIMALFEYEYGKYKMGYVGTKVSNMKLNHIF